MGLQAFSTQNGFGLESILGACVDWVRVMVEAANWLWLLVILTYRRNPCLGQAQEAASTVYF